MLKRKIKWFTTGGTIDSEPYSNPQIPPEDATNELSYVKKLLPKLYQQIRPDLRVDIKKILEEMSQYDSKSMGESQIAALASRIREDNDHEVFVVTHGTDTIAKNSRRMLRELSRHLKTFGKTIIFTGAQMPLSNELDSRVRPKSQWVESDGIRNLEFIIRNFDDQKLFPPGVHVVMGGKHLENDGHMKVEIFSPVGLREAEIEDASGKKYWPFAYIKDGEEKWVDESEFDEDKAPTTTETRRQTRIGPSEEYKKIRALTKVDALTQREPQSTFRQPAR